MHVAVVARGLFSANSVEARSEVVVKVTGSLCPSFYSCAFLPFEEDSFPVRAGLEASHGTAVHYPLNLYQHQGKKGENTHLKHFERHS